MGQLVFSLSDEHASLTLPEPDVEVVPGVMWGDCGSVCTPAYWRALLFQNQDQRPQCRLGRNLLEETVACLLGGYGVPAEVGQAAFNALKEADLVRADVSENAFFERLAQPIHVAGRKINYRFARSKSAGLAHVAAAFGREAPPVKPLRLRNWLMGMPGIGPKTASWIVRNVKSTDDVAILDVHIVRASQYIGLFPAKVAVDRQYFELEERFVRFSKALGVSTMALDACMWAQMKRAGAPLLRRLNLAGGGR